MSISKPSIFGNIKKSEAKKLAMENYKFKGTIGMTEHKRGKKLIKVRQTEGHLSLHVLDVVKILTNPHEYTRKYPSTLVQCFS